MGGAQSSENGHHGFHVLKVKKNSPAFRAGIEQFFDYIISIQGVSLEDGNSKELLRLLQENEDKPVVMGIYSSKNQAVREITLIPTRDWPSEDPNERSLIGCSIRYCSYERAGENVWHVLDIAPNSPAEMAGIIAHSDYIIGSPLTALKSEEDFYQLVEEYVNKPLRLYLYNTEWDSCREVIIVPSHEWGGAGSLGCDVGYGLLHRIPRRHSELTTDTEDNQTTEGGLSRESVNYSNAIFSSPDDELESPVLVNHQEPTSVVLKAPPVTTTDPIVVTSDPDSTQLSKHLNDAVSSMTPSSVEPPGHDTEVKDDAK
ncbi:GRASP55/65 PDZ-like domain-containing protein [Phycomyces nitens]|nr:GRASP55/65 PDZ-like domain-containing protein [Phycomyces nitens]